MKEGAFGPLLTLQRPETILRHLDPGGAGAENEGDEFPQNIVTALTAIFA